MINVVFMGTPQIAVETFLSLVNRADINVLAAITPPDKPQGRKMVMTPPPVKVCANENGIEVFQTKSIRKDEALIKKLKSLNPDFFVTFAFGQILSQEVLDIPKFGTVNVHASLLPKYRGANPIQHALVNGDKKTGVTTMLTSLGMDEGDICLVKEIDIPETMTDVELREKISEVSPDLLYETLLGLYNREITPKKQNAEDATYANKFEKTDGLINFCDSAKAIHNKVRGLLSWPSCYFERDGKKIKVLETSLENVSAQNKVAGEIINADKTGITVVTGEGAIKLLMVQPESKNKMPAFAWNNSIHLKSGDKIC